MNKEKELYAKGYSLSRTFHYGNEFIYIFTDGEYYIYLDGVVGECNEIMWLTVSEPCKIGNVP